MRPVTVRKDDLLSQIETNRAKHRKVFTEAIKGFRTTLRQELEDRIKDLERGSPRSILISRSAPTDHTRDYDNAIAMVKMHVGDTMEIDEQGFNQFVRDDWSWKREFVSTSNVYANAATLEAYGGEEEE